MTIDKTIFRTNDIRGMVPDQLNPETVELLGKGFGSYVKTNSGEAMPKVVLGRDNRLSSEGFAQSLIKGLVATGCHVIDLGVCPTPVFYFERLKLEAIAGMMITGSHNPPQYNGFKLVFNLGAIHDEEIQKVKTIIENGGFLTGKGMVTKDDQAIARYSEEIMARIKLARPLNIVLDTGNATAGLIAPKLYRSLGSKVTELFPELDGNFPNHFPDPTIPKYLETLQARVIADKADVGLAFDGDADRLGAVDDQGKIHWADELMILYAREALALHPGRAIVFDVKCSELLAQEVEKAGGEAVMWKTGHSLIEEKIREKQAIVAGEMSGHIYFNDEWLGFDDAIYAGVRLLRILAASDKKFSEIMAGLPRLFPTPEIRIPCAEENKDRIMAKLKDDFKVLAAEKDYKIIDIDGVRLVTPFGWGLVRRSNTEAMLIARLEGYSPEGLSQLKEIFKEKLLGCSGIELQGALD